MQKLAPIVNIVLFTTCDESSCKPEETEMTFDHVPRSYFHLQEQRLTKYSVLVLAASAVAILSVPAARADSFTFTFTSANVTATGVLQGTLVGGLYDITSGTINVVSATAPTGPGTIVANPNFPGTTTNTTLAGGGTYLTYDDALTPGTNPTISGDGLLFEVEGTSLDLFSDGPDVYEAFGGNYAYDERGTLSITSAATPEPTSLVLLGSSLLGFGGLLRRRLHA